jgi:mono/diheme cytochrome c family protein
MGSKAVTMGASLPLVLIVMTFVGTVIAAGQTPPATAVSGSDLFYNNCAACHGRDGKGDGPMGQVLTIRPADLTIIAKNNRGIFPAAKIYELIDGRNPAVRGHGGPDMPVWGEVFAARGRTASVKNRINALVKYIETLQVK